MPTPCSVCRSPHRSEIDQLLMRQVVNVSALGREYDLGTDALRRHRSNHLPTFLPALDLQAEAPSKQHLHAETQRLYAIALDALADAQAGVLVEALPDGSEVRRVSMSAVSRSIDTARKVLGDMGRLALDGAPSKDATPPADAQLSARITAALDRLDTRALPPASRPAEGVGVGTPGPGRAASPPAASTMEGPVFAAEPSKVHPDQIGGDSREIADRVSTFSAEGIIDVEGEEATLPAHVKATLDQAQPCDCLEGDPCDQWAKYRWAGNPAASLDERRAAGHTPPPGPCDEPLPAREPDPRDAFRP